MQSNQEALFQLAEEFLGKLGVDAHLSLRQVEDETFVLHIHTTESALLIGKAGQNLIALESLLRAMYFRKTTDPLPFSVDIDEYRERKAAGLRALARRIAEKVLRYKKPEMLRPMTAFERRIIHTTLANVPDVATESVGIDPERRVMIKPAEA